MGNTTKIVNIEGAIDKTTIKHMFSIVIIILSNFILQKNNKILKPTIIVKNTADIIILRAVFLEVLVQQKSEIAKAIKQIDSNI